jgi:aspartate-semialdehyde dehydrogenase
LAKRRLALAGSETLLGREIRDLVTTGGHSYDLRLIATDEELAGKLTEESGEPTFIAALDRAYLEDAGAVVLACSPESARKALEIAPDAVFIDLSHGTEDSPRARLRAPMVESEIVAAPGAVHLIAHPAAIALSAVLNRLHSAHPIGRCVAHVLVPASERGTAGIDELHQQALNLFAFKGLPKKVFDAQLSFNLLAGYGDEAPISLQDSELRIERHLASLLASPGSAPMPSVRLIQAPVFHGHSISVWVEFRENPGPKSLEKVLSSEPFDVRSSEMEPPNIVGMAGQDGIAVGSIARDRNEPRACWLWVVADNIRLAAQNAILVARQVAPE